MMSLESKFQRLYFNDFYNSDLGVDIESILYNLAQNDEVKVTKDQTKTEYCLTVFEVEYCYSISDERDTDYNTLLTIFDKYQNELAEENEY